MECFKVCGKSVFYESKRADMGVQKGGRDMVAYVCQNLLYLSQFQCSTGANPLAWWSPVVENGCVLLHSIPRVAASHVGSCSAAVGSAEDPKMATLDPWKALCAEFTDVFEEPWKPQDRPTKHRIDLIDPMQPLFYHRQYRMSEAEQAKVRSQLDALLDRGWIQPSTSGYNHPILFVKKKCGAIRMCIDFRRLN